MSVSAPACLPFPFAHSGEPALPRYLLTRAEGLPLRQAILSGLSYLRKYRSPKTTAPIEEVAYFDHQRQLLRFLCAAPAPPVSVRLGMVGDLMWLRHGWGSFLAPAVLDSLNAHDAVVGNLESVISPRFKVPALLPDYFTYNADPALVTSFRRADGRSTFSALATCNNHCLDRGDAGLLDTLDFLDAQGIPHAGVRRAAGEQNFVTWETKGIKFGFYATCWGFNNPDLGSLTKLHVEVLPGLVPRVQHPVDLGAVRRALAGMAAQGMDFKIVYLHWGYEFEFYPCPDLMQVGREVVRAGADVVVGSHPHVVQPLEVCFVNGYERRYAQDMPALLPQTGCLLQDGTGVARKGLIVYSLGNFATAMFTLHCQTGLLAGLHLVRNEEGRVDWERPELRLVFNVQRDPATRARRLLFLDDYLAERVARGDRCPKLRRLATFLREHLLGAPALSTAGAGG